jgi:hypothetical protein
MQSHLIRIQMSFQDLHFSLRFSGSIEIVQKNTLIQNLSKKMEFLKHFW